MSKRKKIILSIIAFIILIGVGIFSWAIYTDRVFLGASGKQYSAKFVKQEPKGEINLKKGELKRFSIEFKNTGRITWKNYGNQGVYLVDAKDKISNFWVPNNDFYQKVNQYKLGSGWLNPFRITFLQNSVKSQQTATFTFFIQAPFKKGEYQEGFKLVDASGKQVNNSKTAIKFNVIDEIMIEKINKNSAIYQEIKDKLGDGIIPQTYPIKIKVGNRDKIYELMNQSGYGVVSLYHTLIEPLRNSEHSDALSLSKQILNLPVHQDVNSNEYENMVELLAKYCIETV